MTQRPGDRRSRATARRRGQPVALVLAIPALAMVLGPVLPFVNTTTLWFGLPALLVWESLALLLLTPAFLLVYLAYYREDGGE